MTGNSFRQLRLRTSLKRVYCSAALLAICWLGCLALPTIATLENQTTPWEEQTADGLLGEISAEIEAQAFASESERIDYIRDWVHQNSVHLIDKDHDRHAYNIPEVLGMLWQTYRLRAPPVHLSCGPRAAAMRSILKDLGVPSRVVFIFSDEYNNVRSHTFLEVFNSEEHGWEIQDPDFNITYVDRQNRRRVDTVELLWGDGEGILPHSPTATGWDENQVRHLKDHYFEAMMYFNYPSGTTSVLVNPERFQPGKHFVENDNSTFYEFAKTHYNNPSVYVGSKPPEPSRR